MGEKFKDAVEYCTNISLVIIIVGLMLVLIPMELHLWGLKNERNEHNDGQFAKWDTEHVVVIFSNKTDNEYTWAFNLTIGENSTDGFYNGSRVCSGQCLEDAMVEYAVGTPHTIYPLVKTPGEFETTYPYKLEGTETFRHDINTIWITWGNVVAVTLILNLLAYLDKKCKWNRKPVESTVEFVPKYQSEV